MGHKRGNRKRFNNAIETIYQGEQRYGMPMMKASQAVGGVLTMFPPSAELGLVLEGGGLVGEQMLKGAKSVHDGKAKAPNVKALTKGFKKLGQAVMK